MKHLRIGFCISMMFLALLSACGPQATPTETEAPGTSAPETAAPPVETATLVTVPTEAPATATLTPVVLAGPEMAVGSHYPYVDGTVLIAVPAGVFTMGRPGGTNNPERPVTLPDFWIYSTKVTNQQYARCELAGQCSTPDLQDDQGYNDYAHLNDPVVGVNYDQAAAYCKFVHGRLPTEAEWEKTARGPDANIYPWGNGAPSDDLLNYNNTLGHTTNVTKYGPGASYYGGLDLEGNTYEWVADWFDDLYYKIAPAENPVGPDAGTQRSVRSAGYKSVTEQIPSSVRSFDNPKDHRRDLGFRCVVDDPTYFAPSCSLVGFYGNDVGGAPNSGNPCLVQVSVNAVPQKCGSGSTYVTFKSDNAGATNPPQGVSTCSLIQGAPGSFPQVYDCGPGSGPAIIDAACDVSTLGEAKCPVHYTFDSGSGDCKWDGTGTAGKECLPNQTYDPVNQCCTAGAPGTGAEFPLCQVGSSPIPLGGGKYGCLVGVAGVSSDNAAIIMPPACGGGNPGPCDPATDPTCKPGGGGCQPQTCGYKEMWCKSTCSCVSMFGGCP